MQASEFAANQREKNNKRSALQAGPCDFHIIAMELGKVSGGEMTAPADPGQLTALPQDLMRALRKHVDPKNVHILNGLRRLGTLGDGTCFYHSILSMLNYKGYNTKDERRRKELAYAFRCGMKNIISPDNLAAELEYTRLGHDALPREADILAQKLCDPKVWADELVIRALTRRFHWNLVFWDATTQQFYCGVQGSKPESQVTMLVIWIAHSHFEAVVMTDASGAIHSHEPGMFRPGHPIQRALMSVYRDLCRRPLMSGETLPQTPDIFCDGDNRCDVTSWRKRNRELRAIQKRYLKVLRDDDRKGLRGGKHRKRRSRERKPRTRLQIQNLVANIPGLAGGGLVMETGNTAVGGGANGAPKPVSKAVLASRLCGGVQPVDDDHVIVDPAGPTSSSPALRLPRRIAVAFDKSVTRRQRRFMMATLTDRRRGWARYGLQFHEVNPSNAATNIHVFMASPQELEALFPGAGMSKWSVTRGDVSPVAIYFNTDNWELGHKTSGHASRAAYWHYVVNHEFGHALGWSHDECPGSGEHACIMQQHTHGTGGCSPVEWPEPNAACYGKTWHPVGILGEDVAKL
jgi:hypothetical protein